MNEHKMNWTMCLIPPPTPPPPASSMGLLLLLQGRNKTQGSNIIMSTSFALKVWSNKVIAVDIIISFTLTAA